MITRFNLLSKNMFLLKYDSFLGLILREDSKFQELSATYSEFSQHIPIIQ